MDQQPALCDRCGWPAAVTVLVAGSHLSLCPEDRDTHWPELVRQGAQLLNGDPPPRHQQSEQVELDSSMARHPSSRTPDSEPERWTRPGTGLIDLPLPDGSRLLWRVNADGRLSDGPDGEPAILHIHPDGCRSVTHMDDGRLADGRDGSPAVLDHDAAGNPRLAVRAHRGVPSDMTMTDGQVAAAVVGLDTAGDAVFTQSWLGGRRQR